MKATENLRTKLMILAGLPPGRPTDQELRRIIEHILKIRSQRTPTETDWKQAAAAVVAGAGGYVYKAEDMSDLNELLLAILSESEG
jgi:hypothetical protein